jgi:hypothetical protein
MAITLLLRFNGSNYLHMQIAVQHIAQHRRNKIKVIYSDDKKYSYSSKKYTENIKKPFPLASPELNKH